MPNIIDLVSSVTLPFLQNPQIAYVLILLILGMDALYSINPSEPQILSLEEGQYFVLWGTNIDGEPNCSRTDGTWLPTNLIFPPRRATNDEINLYCKGFFDPSVACAKTLTCDDTENAKLGLAGGVLTTAINTSASAFDKESILAKIKISSWEIFALMLVIPLMVWCLTASTNP